MLKFNGVLMPAPTKFVPSIIDVDKKSGRNAAAYMMRNRIRKVRKLELEWHLISAEETSKILKAVSPEFIEVEYYDMEDNQLKTGTFMAGDRSAAAVAFKNGVPIWKGLKFNLIER